jgi:hypothetical protein
LTAIITLTSLKTAALKFQTNVNTQSVRQANQPNEEVYLEGTPSETEMLVEFHKQLAEMEAEAWQNNVNSAQKIE